jgi:hypothetical protein
MPSTRGIGRLLPIMLSAIEFNDQLCFAAGEINNVGTDKRLPPEVRACQDNVMTKPLPEHALGIGRFGAHPVRKLSLAINHRAGFNHIRQHLWTPTPDPSPQEGEGRRIPLFAKKASAHAGALPSPLRGGVGGGGQRALNFVHPAPPASVCTQASPQALASSRTRMM